MPRRAPIAAHALPRTHTHRAHRRAPSREQVLEGPFKGLRGPVVPAAEADAAEGKDRELVTVALPVMGREMAMALPPRHLLTLHPEGEGGARQPMHPPTSRSPAAS